MFGRAKAAPAVDAAVTRFREVPGAHGQVPGETTGARTVPLRAAVGALAVLAVAGWLVAFYLGFAPWLGGASITTSSFGIPGVGAPLSIIGRDQISGTFGTRTMVLFPGQEFYVRYETTIRRGMLVVSLGPPSRRVAFTEYRYVRDSGAGEITFRIPRIGIYEVRHDAMPDGRGYDLDYRLSWGARPSR